MSEIYMVDYENVGSEGLSGINGLSAGDKVKFFYSAKSSTINIKLHIQICKSTVNFEYIEAAVGGKNALDHQLSTYLGYLISKSKAENISKIYIVSKDGGYRYITDFWSTREKDVKIECIEAIKNAKTNGGKIKEKDATYKAIDKMLDSHQTLKKDDVHDLIISGDKQALCNLLRKELGQEVGLKFYHEIKKYVLKQS